MNGKCKGLAELQSLNSKRYTHAESLYSGELDEHSSALIASIIVYSG